MLDHTDLDWGVEDLELMQGRLSEFSSKNSDMGPGVRIRVRSKTRIRVRHYRTLSQQSMDISDSICCFRM